MSTRFSAHAVVAMMLSMLLVSSGEAVVFQGIDFPQGEASFADAVLRYDPAFSGGRVPSAATQLPDLALGAPDGAYVPLGSGGLLELLFTDNVLTNSGSAGADLHVFEVGRDVEDTFVAVRPTSATLSLLSGDGFAIGGDGFFALGKVFGANSAIDIDSVFNGYAAGTLSFDAVQLIDDPDDGARGGVTVGADIDAVGAISTAAAVIDEPDLEEPTEEPVTDPVTHVIPEPMAAALSGLGIAALALATRRRRAR